MTSCLPSNCLHEIADIPVLKTTILFWNVRVSKRLQARDVFEKIGNAHVVDTTADEMNRLQRSCECTVRTFHCHVGNCVIRDYTARAVEISYARQGQKRARPIQITTFLGFQWDRKAECVDASETESCVRQMRPFGFANDDIDELFGCVIRISFFW